MAPVRIFITLLAAGGRGAPGAEASVSTARSRRHRGRRAPLRPRMRPRSVRRFLRGQAAAPGRERGDPSGRWGRVRSPPGCSSRAPRNGTLDVQYYNLAGGFDRATCLLDENWRVAAERGGAGSAFSLGRTTGNPPGLDAELAALDGLPNVRGAPLQSLHSFAGRNSLSFGVSNFFRLETPDAQQVLHGGRGRPIIVGGRISRRHLVFAYRPRFTSTNGRYRRAGLSARPQPMSRRLSDALLEQRVVLSGRLDPAAAPEWDGAAAGRSDEGRPHRMSPGAYFKRDPPIAAHDESSGRGRLPIDWVEVTLVAR